MSLSSTALKQREKEAKALRFFLVYSSIGSIILHIGIFALFISYFLMKLPQIKDEPIELTLLEVPNQEVKKLPEIPESPLKVNAGGGGGGKSGQQQISQGADPSSTSVVKQPSIQPSQQSLPKITPVITPPIQNSTDKSKTAPQPPIAPPETSKPVVTQPPITDEPSLVPNNSTRKLVERLKTPPQPPIPVTEPSKPVANTVPTVPASSTSVTSINPQSNGTQRSLTSSQTTNSRTTSDSGNASNNGLSNGAGSGSGDGSGNGVGSGAGNGVGSGSGNGIGDGAGDGVGNQPKKEGTTVATAPTPPTDKEAVLDRADCIRCDIKYPDRAKRLRIQGNAEIALDADENGNVIRVWLVRSTGDRELDEAAQTAAQDWKLKPKSGGRQGVRAAVNFRIKTSQRYR